MSNQTSFQNLSLVFYPLKVLEALINTELVKHLTSYGLFSDK